MTADTISVLGSEFADAVSRRVANSTQIDVKTCLSDPEIRLTAGGFMIECARRTGCLPKPTAEGHMVVAGFRDGGNSVAGTMACASVVYDVRPRLHEARFVPTTRGSSFHRFGAPVSFEEVLMVDDVIHSGMTFTALSQMLEDSLAEPSGAVVLVDRRHSDAMMPFGMKLQSVLTYDQSKGLLVPSEVMA